MVEEIISLKIYEFKVLEIIIFIVIAFAISNMSFACKIICKKGFLSLYGKHVQMYTYVNVAIHDFFLPSQLRLTEHLRNEK